MAEYGSPQTGAASAWPELRFDDWAATRQTLHRWVMIVGKVRMALTPLVNHYWNVPLYVTARGLTTSAMHHGDRTGEIEFDFIDHVLVFRVNDGTTRSLPLEAKTTAAFYSDVKETLRALGVAIEISTLPVEIVDEPLPLDRDELHRSYDRDAANRFFHVLSSAEKVFTQFRSEFIGKCSPVHFFWGSFDLAVTRFSGRRAPERPDADKITRESYSHEVSSVGFWPGDSRLQRMCFYSYAAPEPDGFPTATIQPAKAYYVDAMYGWYFDYDEVRCAKDPEETLLTFCRSTYDAAATLGKWDRAALERRR